MDPPQTPALTRYFLVLLYKSLCLPPLKKLSKAHGGTLILAPKFFLKSKGFAIDCAEGSAMEFVRRNTSIPVPKVHAVFKHRDRVYIVMEKIEGSTLIEGWSRRSDESKKKILSQLKGMIAQLRNIPPPGDFVGVANIQGGPIFDQRLPKDLHWGPFNTIDEFHSALVEGNDLTNIRDGKFAELRDLSCFYKQAWSKPVFTHGDLSGNNILVRGDEVVGIVDWESAGWFPPYWEYTTAWNYNKMDTGWQQDVDTFLTPLPYARDMDAIRWKFFGFIGVDI